MADYTIPSGQPAPTTPPPPPAPSAPPPPPAPMDASLTANPNRGEPARPEVTTITVLARRVVWTEGPGQAKGSVEYQVGLTATPDPTQPASASLDRLELAARTKLQQYLQGAL